MTYSTALCVGADIAGRRSQCEVVSCYPHACNLRLAHGPLLTLLHGIAERGMRLVNLPPKDWPTLTDTFRPGQQLRLDESGLSWPGGHIDFSQAQVWHTRPAPALDPARLTRPLARLQNMLDAAESKQPHNLLRQAAFHRFHILLAQLVTAPDTIEPAVAALLGAGPGLTPTGDDLLCGLLAGLQTCDPRGAYLPLAFSIDQQLARTNAVSQEYLSQSCRGWLSENMVQLIDTLRRNQPLDKAFGKLAAHGHTSGLDTMHGLAGAWRLAQKNT